MRGEGAGKVDGEGTVWHPPRQSMGALCECNEPYAETMQCWGLTIGSVLEPDHRGTRWDKRAGRTVDHVDDSELQGQAHAMPTRTDVHL